MRFIFRKHLLHSTNYVIFGTMYGIIYMNNDQGMINENTKVWVPVSKEEWLTIREIPELHALLLLNCSDHHVLFYAFSLYSRIEMVQGAVS